MLVNTIYNFPPLMVFFTTPELLEIGGLPLVTPYDKPTRLEALRYYRRVVDRFGIQVSFHEEVREIEREDDGTFVVTNTPSGGTRVRHARAVVLAIGYYDLPNYLGIPGEDLPHVSNYFTDAHPYFRQRVVVVGGKNSAAEASLELYRGGAHVTLVHRRATLGDSIKYWVRPDIENRIKEGSIATRFESCVVEIRPTEVIIGRNGETEAIPAEGVFLLTGYHPDAELMRRAGIECHAESLDADARSGDVREQRAEPVHRRWRRGGSQHRQHFHRERPLSRRADREGHSRQTAAGGLNVRRRFP